MLFRSARRAFVGSLDVKAIESAIRKVEQTTTGDIRVAMLPRFRGTIEEMVERTVHRLGMTSTPERNGVIILVDPSRRRFRVWGDRAIHEKVGQAFWHDVVAAIEDRFRSGDFQGGLLHGVAVAGKALEEHFPASPGAVHTLPDGVDLS